MRRPLALLAAACLLAAAPMARAEGTGFGPCAPYLQNGKPGEITIVWREAQPVATRVRVLDERGHTAYDEVVDVAPQQQATVTGLKPGGRYEYSVQAPDRLAQGGRFTVNRAGDADHLRFAVIGDMGDGSTHQYNVAKRMQEWSPEIVVTVGDNVYPNAAPEEFGPNFFTPYEALLANTCFYPTLGNHDVRTANGAPYLSVFRLPQEPSKGRYYAFDDGPARFWCLDSNESLAPGSAQYEWLAADAAASHATWKFAAFHHPPYSSGLHGQEARNRRWLPALFSKLGFQLVFTGHDHHYERSKPIGGVTYVVTGGGGAMLYGTTEQPFTAAKSTRHEFVAVSVYKHRLGITTIGEQGQRIDAASLNLDDKKSL